VDEERLLLSDRAESANELGPGVLRPVETDDPSPFAREELGDRAADPRRPEWEVVGARHAGITVSDLDRSLAHYCDLLGMELLWRRLYREREIGAIVGIEDATAFDIAMVQIPGSDLTIELIEYQGCERRSGSTEPCNYGSGHFCVFVRGIDALYGELSGKGVAFRSDGPIEMTDGPNRGGKSLYSLDPDGYIVEFHQPPPHLARS
jgi:catechol 2,3-dioxygenase-like lactoylglutathione lyase family enzyme